MVEDKLNDLAVFLDGQIEKLNKLKRGGKRKNSGAKPKYSEPTKTTAFRIPISKIKEVKEVVNRMLSVYTENNQ